MVIVFSGPICSLPAGHVGWFPIFQSWKQLWNRHVWANNSSNTGFFPWNGFHEMRLLCQDAMHIFRSLDAHWCFGFQKVFTNLHPCGCMQDRITHRSPLWLIKEQSELLDSQFSIFLRHGILVQGHCFFKSFTHSMLNFQFQYYLAFFL